MTSISHAPKRATSKEIVMGMTEKERKYFVRFEKSIKLKYFNYLVCGILFGLAIIGIVIGIFINDEGFLLPLALGSPSLLWFLEIRKFQQLYKIIIKCMANQTRSEQIKMEMTQKEKKYFVRLEKTVKQKDLKYVGFGIFIGLAIVGIILGIFVNDEGFLLPLALGLPTLIGFLDIRKSQKLYKIIKICMANQTGSDHTVQSQLHLP
jgi:hypothetical protein